MHGTQVYMCANEWQDLKYTRVPSVCMKNNKGSFEEHDKQRFTQYLEDVQAGKKSIASGALKPHELVGEAMQASRSGTHACTCKASKSRGLTCFSAVPAALSGIEVVPVAHAKQSVQSSSMHEGQGRCAHTNGASSLQL